MGKIKQEGGKVERIKNKRKQKNHKTIERRRGCKGRLKHPKKRM